MSYFQAVALGWSIYWRQAVRAGLFVALVIPLFVWLRETQGWDRRSSNLLFAALCTLTLLGVLFPPIIRDLPEVRFSDFRLSPVRRGEPARISYVEAVLLAFAVNAVPALAAPLLEAALTNLPLIGPILAFTFPVAVAMPLSAVVLTGFRLTSLRLEIAEPDSGVVL